VNRYFLKFCSLLFIVGGLVIVCNATLPIVLYEIKSYYSFRKTELISPVVAEDLLSVNPISTVSGGSLTHASEWFPGTTALLEGQNSIKYYTITVPRLKIYDAQVEVGGDDLDKSLIHYQGTSLPGQNGNAIIFGHSALPQFFKPTSYLSVFAKLPTMQAGDEIIVNFDGISYKFKVEEMFEVKPTDIEVLAQKFDDSYLTLVTCVPPGTILRRLIVRARIAPNG
jgi:sortase A